MAQRQLWKERWKDGGEDKETEEVRVRVRVSEGEGAGVLWKPGFRVFPC